MPNKSSAQISVDQQQYAKTSKKMKSINAHELVFQSDLAETC